MHTDNDKATKSGIFETVIKVEKLQKWDKDKNVLRIEVKSYSKISRSAPL